MKTHILLILMVMTALVCTAQSEGLRLKPFSVKKTLALEGYDVISYFNGKLSEGNETFKHQHKGVVYWFASAANLNKFRTSPDKYEPAYGGWCAYAMGESGEKAKIHPGTYKIADGKLYLFLQFLGQQPA